MDLNAKMEFDHVIRVREDGTVEDAAGVYAPEVSVDTDDDGQILAEHERAMLDGLRSEGWELLNGFSNQYCYAGPIMHPSEFIGGGLATYILENPGFYVAVAVETMDDSEEPAGWAVAFRESI